MKSLKEINVLKYLLLGLGLLYICFYIFIALSRLNYPFELEGVEGAILDQVRKISEEGKLYTQPSLKFTPFMYTPLYFYIGAILFKIFGEGFLALRLISFLSSLGILILIFKFLKREGANPFYSLLAVCFFASTYPLSGAWMDLARIDSLFVLLLGITFYLLRFKPTKLGYLVAGIFASLAFFTKQITFLILLPLTFYTVLKDKKKGFYFPFSFICIVISLFNSRLHP
jgi:4-amino-4-deoxy-L-arabinose transferase-like glycosyltransferase